MTFELVTSGLGSVWLKALDLGNLTPFGGMKLFSISQSMAFLDAYCLASFFLVNETVSPNGWELSTKTLVQLNLDGAAPTTLSIYFNPSAGGFTARYSRLR